MDTVDKVIEDLKERKQVGIERYGSALSTETPVNTLEYAYEEALDLAVYLRCELDKQK
jgi:hypothetical protein